MFVYIQIVLYHLSHSLLFPGAVVIPLRLPSRLYPISQCLSVTDVGFWASNSRWHAAMLFLLFEFSESLAWSSLALVARYTRGLAMQNKMSLASHARICVCLMLFGVCSNYILCNVLVQSFLHRWYSLWFFERTWITCLGKKALVNLIDVCVYTNCLISPQPLSAFWGLQ